MVAVIVQLDPDDDAVTVNPLSEQSPEAARVISPSPEPPVTCNNAWVPGSIVLGADMTNED